MEIQKTYSHDSDSNAQAAKNFRTVHSPLDQKPIAEIEVCSREQAFGWLKEANQFFQDQSKWVSAVVRAKALNEASAKIESQIEFFTKLIALEGGKPYKDAKAEVVRACQTLKIAAQEALMMHGEQIPMQASASGSGHLAMSVREPVGVVFAISAFNHPLNLIAHQVGSALAAGCPILIKPASETPLSCVHLVQLLNEAGIPKAALRWLLCENEVSEALACSPEISFLSFIGSAKVGWSLHSKVAPGTRVALEHGGTASVIIDETADLDPAVPTLVKGAYYHSGQVCVSIQKIFVHSSRKSELLEKLKSAVLKLKTGDALDVETDCGPIIRARDVGRIMEWMDEATKKGAKLVCGGKKISESLIEPTILADVPEETRIMREEVFGPVVCVNAYEKIEDAYRGANEVPFVFQAAIFTKNLDRAFEASRKLKATAVMINESTTFRTDWMPFAGGGVSGLGVGGVPYSAREMTREKMLLLRSPAWVL